MPQPNTPFLDLHPDQFYEAHTSTEDGIACHRKKGAAGYYGAETSDCDTPFSLVNATFDWIEENIKDDIDFVIWTGDTARHDNDDKIPRNEEQVVSTNKWVVDKFLEAFAESESSKKLAVPIVPNFGNNDFLPHNIFLPGPNRWTQKYQKLWKRFIPEEQVHSFQFGGWFYVEVVPSKLAVFSLNTMYFFDRNAGVDGCQDKSEPGYQQMEWLRVHLQMMRENGMKAILIGHVPPARTDSKQNWDETCWQRYNLWLKQFRDVIVGSMYGHMNIDHFLLHDTHDVEIRTLDSGLPSSPVRTAFEDDMSATSKEDYLQELRKHWSKLPKAVAKNDFEADGKKKKKKKEDWVERYHLSFISPSVVPNYFPTLRVFEYNISSLEESTAWEDSFDAFDTNGPSLPPSYAEAYSQEELKRDLEAERKKKKHKKPHDPDLTVPDPPSKSSAPGPAYSNQPLSLLGYTQYFANLTHLNNDIKSTKDFDSEGWREGKHNDEDIEGKPKPLPFEYQVEYSTFTDKVYKLKDLTVKNYVKLAYRMAQKKAKGKALDQDYEDDEDDDEMDDLGEMDELDDLDEMDELDEDEVAELDDKVDAEGKKHKKHKKHKKKRNKVWLEFLSRAFVKTVPKKKLKKLEL